MSNRHNNDASRSPRYRIPEGQRTQKRMDDGMGYAQTSRHSASQHYTASKASQGAGGRRGHVAQAYTSQVDTRKRKRRKVAILTTVAAILIALVAFGITYMNKISSQLNAGVDDSLRNSLASVDAGKPFYMLLLGTDRSKAREKEAGFGNSYHNFRTDTIILARVDPKTPRVSLVSIHRDTLVDMGKHGKQKINASYAIGGPSYTTEVVSKFAGVPISHYAEIDFDSFLKIIDQLGGVEVNVPQDVVDHKYANGEVKAGRQTINGDQALFLCRARHAYDKYGDGDAFRAANQRMIIAAIIKKILASDPATMTKTIDECSKYVTTDLTLPQVLTLATQMHGLNPSKDIYSGINPTISKYVNNVWYELCNVDAWKKMMERVDKGLTPYANPKEDITFGIAGSPLELASESERKSIEKQQSDGSSSAGSSNGASSATVTVLNGSGQPGLAGRIASSLQKRGFDATAANASSFSHGETVVIYNGDHGKQAERIAHLLGADIKTRKNDGTYPTSTDVVVILGSDR